MDRQLSIIAKKIEAAKREQKRLAKRLERLAKRIKSNEAVYKRLQTEEKEYRKTLQKLNDDIDKKQKKFLDLVAKNFSLALALDELRQPTQESVMMKEAYKLYAKENSKEIEKLERDITFLKDKKADLEKKKQKIQKAIASYEEERNEYRDKKVKQDKLVKNLARDRAIYKKRFNKIRASRKRLEKKLAKLKIIKQRSEKKSSRVKKEQKRVIKSDDKIVKKSIGKKTISPLKGSRLIKKFGTYIDPIYKFKIFNKSITLKAPHVGSKVRSVLSGKIVFAENSGGMLGKVVIIEHSNNIHTIYAKLSRLAPGVRVGKKVLKGTIIGKVDKTLMFEVTKNNKHINPLRLINL